MYHGVENLHRLLEENGVPPGTPPDVPGPDPHPDVDAYLFDGSRRLALHHLGAVAEDEVPPPGRYAAARLDDPAAEELARALRIVAEAEPEEYAEGDRDAFVEAAVEQAMDEWSSGQSFGNEPPVRHQLIEDVVRSSWETLAPDIAR